jgi:coenzyme F420-reducing hydrogenase gamma subunit
MKQKIAFFDFASCEGCQLQVIDLEEKFLELIDLVDIVTFREAMDENNNDYDIAFVEGSIIREMDEKRLKDIRAKAKYIVAFGDCACNGCVNKLRNLYNPEDIKKEVYGENISSIYLDVKSVKAIDEVVEVDYYLRGCPIKKEELLYLINRFINGIQPHKNQTVRFNIEPKKATVDTSSIITYSPEKCILCRNCHVICNDILDVHAIGVSQRGNKTIISTPFNEGLKASNCIYCGQCSVFCPVGAFAEQSHVLKATEILKDPSNFVIIAIDPIAISSYVDVLDDEEGRVGLYINKLIEAFKSINAKRVIDFTKYIYLSYVEQGDYISNNRNMVFSSWCPGLRNFVEKSYPQYLRHIQREATPSKIMHKFLSKRYVGENLKLILITPCVAQKNNTLFDAVLTTRELPSFLSKNKLDLDRFKGNSDFDRALDIGWTYIMGAHSDYAYALSILETAYLKRFGDLDVTVSVSTIEDRVYELAFDSEKGFFNALLLEDMSKVQKYMEKDVEKYNVVEFFPCLHGCITGGGQNLTNSFEVISKRVNRLKDYKGLCTSKKEFLTQIIMAYNRYKEVVQ